MRDALQAGTVTVAGAGGDDVEAYTAQPLDGPPTGGVVVIHHMPGFDEATKEIVRRFARWGFNAVCPNLYWREAPGADSDDAAATARAAGGVPDERLLGDVGGAADYLRSLPSANGRVGTIGFCSGGRQSVLAACELDIDAAVDCYGAFVVGATPPAGQKGLSPVRMTPLNDRLPKLRAPLLGLFGNEDAHPSPADVDELDGLLTGNGKEHEFHRFDGAGHAFFAVDRPAYRQAVAVPAWELVRDFFTTHLAA